MYQSMLSLLLWDSQKPHSGENEQGFPGTVVTPVDPISHEKKEFASKSGFTALSKHGLRVSTI